MKKPHVICLMASSVDGRTLPSRWRPKGSAGNLFERVHDELAGDAWLVGRVTGQEFAKGKPYPCVDEGEPFRASPGSRGATRRRTASCWTPTARSAGAVRTSVAIRSWSCCPRRSRMRTWRACAAKACPTSLPESSELDLALTLDILNRELGVKRLLLEGGGGANGAFLRAGLVDELHLILCPAVDGAKGAPSVFDSADAEADQPRPVAAMTLESSQALEGGAMLLQYRIQNASPDALAVR